MIDKLLCEHIDKNVSSKDVAVLLSGGVDSISVAYAAAKLKKNIHCYSFCLDINKNYDFTLIYCVLLYTTMKTILRSFFPAFTYIKVIMEHLNCQLNHQLNLTVLFL